MMRIPRGRAMRRSVADAIEAGSIVGVGRIQPDPVDTAIVYITCTPRAWARLQVLAARHIGVTHTGEYRAQLIVARWTLPSRGDAR